MPHARLPHAASATVRCRARTYVPHFFVMMVNYSTRARAPPAPGGPGPRVARLAATSPRRAPMSSGRAGVSRYRHDKFSDWSLSVQACVWVAAVLGPALLVFGIILLVRSWTLQSQACVR